ncbi:hypothetical protein RI367_007524 [Sorochytrium milnesiophthora]
MASWLNWESNITELPVARDYLRSLHLTALVFSCVSLVPASYLLGRQQFTRPGEKGTSPPATSTTPWWHRLSQIRFKPRLFFSATGAMTSAAWRPLPTECLVLALTGFNVADIAWHALLLVDAVGVHAWAIRFFVQNVRYVVGYTGLTCYFVGIAYSIPASVMASLSMRKIMQQPWLMNGYLLFFTIGPLATTGITAALTGETYQRVNAGIAGASVQLGDILFTFCWTAWMFFTSMFALSLTTFGRPLVRAIEENVATQRGLLSTHPSNLDSATSKGSVTSTKDSASKSVPEHVPSPLHASVNSNATADKDAGLSNSLGQSNASKLIRTVLASTRRPSRSSTATAKTPRPHSVLQLRLLQQSATKIRLMVYLLPIASLTFASANVLMILLKWLDWAGLRTVYPQLFVGSIGAQTPDTNVFFYVPATVHIVSGGVCVCGVMTILAYQEWRGDSVRSEMRQSRGVPK